MTYEARPGSGPAHDPEFDSSGFENCYELLKEHGYEDATPEEYEWCEGCPVQSICPMYAEYTKCTTFQSRKK